MVQPQGPEAVTTNILGLLVLWKGVTYWVCLWFPSHLCGSRFFGSFIQILVVFKKINLICIQMQYTQAPSWMALCYAYRGVFRKGTCVHKARPEAQCGSWSYRKQNGKNIKSCSETQHIGTGRSGKSSLSLLWQSPLWFNILQILGLEGKSTFQLPFSSVMNSRTWRFLSERHIGAVEAAGSCEVSDRGKDLKWLLPPPLHIAAFPDWGSTSRSWTGGAIISEWLTFILWHVKMNLC